MALIAGVVCDELSEFSKRACIERHLKKTGLLESSYHSSYAIIEVDDSDCEPYIKCVSDTYVEKVRQSFSTNVQTEPLVDCIISGLEPRKAADYDIASIFFDDQHLHDQDKELKYKHELAEIVMDVVQKCGAQATLGH